MEIKKGDKLTVRCNRKGTYNAVATADFDTVADEWYSVAVDQEELIYGMSEDWGMGDDIPCRRGQATITKRKEDGTAK